MVMWSCMLSLIYHKQHILPKTDSGFLEMLNCLPTWEKISILPVTLPEDTHRFITKWKLQVLLVDQRRHHSDRMLLRFSLQGHLNDNANVELDAILKVMLERLDALSSFPLFFKGGKKVGWHVFCVTSKNAKLVRGFVKEVWALTKFRHIQRLQSFLEKVAVSMKVVTSMVKRYNDAYQRCASSTKFFS